MKITRAMIDKTAREYMDTPFAPKGRVKGQRTDCVGLVLMVAGDLGLADKSGMPIHAGLYTTYPDQPVGNYVYDLCMQHLVYKPVREMLPGDVLCLNQGAGACHVGFCSESSDGRVSIIHAYSGGPNAVKEQPLDFKWQRRIVGCFKFPEVD